MGEQLPGPDQDPLTRVISAIVAGLTTVAVTAFIVFVVLPGMVVLAIVALVVLALLALAGVIWAWRVRLRWQRYAEQLHRRAERAQQQGQAYTRRPGERPRKRVQSRVRAEDEEPRQS